MTSSFAWQKQQNNGNLLWFKGYWHNRDSKQILTDLSEIKTEAIADYLAQLDGHFALLFQNNDYTLLAVDKIRSTPLFFTKKNKQWLLGNDASVLVKSANLNSINDNALLAFKMAGYTIGEDTLYRGLKTLIAGQCAIFNKKEQLEKKQYYQWQPWLGQFLPNQDSDLAIYQKQLSEITLRIIKKMIRSISGRQVVIPLSAGNDSRLIASALRHLGYDNVVCYSYGIKSNFEAKMSAKIAKKLGYQWYFVPLSIKKEKVFYQSKEYEKYLQYADSYCATPVSRWLSTVKYLKALDVLDKNAVFINGNTGDFISGGHISKPLHTKEVKNFEVLCQESIKKHFSLWQHLKTNSHLEGIKAQLKQTLTEINQAEQLPNYALFEYLEFINRQSKYVISSQRIYEFYGYDWRLPLWDDEYLNFWQQVPLRFKAGQKLYKQMLARQNWGNVWSENLPINRQNIRPYTLILLRFLLKLFVFVFKQNNKKYWHQLERRFVLYWLDDSCVTALFSYRQFIASKGMRSVVSLASKQYLINKKIKYDC